MIQSVLAGKKITASSLLKNVIEVAILLEHKDSKSFLSVMTLMLRCILFPGAHLFVTSGGKEQAASILHDKVNEICDLIPALKREIDWGRGKTQEGKDKVRYIFKNGSVLDNLAARESSRGQRRHGKKIMTSLQAILINLFIIIFIYNRKLK